MYVIYKMDPIYIYKYTYGYGYNFRVTCSCRPLLCFFGCPQENGSICVVFGPTKKAAHF